MASDDLIVIYDPELQMAALVNTAERIGWGPAMVGPQAGAILNAFVDTTPFDLTLLAGYEAKKAFDSFLQSAGLDAPPEETSVVNDPVEQAATESMANGNALAEYEAAGSSDIPAEQPADTDTQPEPEPQETTTPQGQVIDCPNCNGTGQADGAQCGMCQGNGKLTIAANV